MPLARQAGADHQRSRAARHPEPALERVEHHLARQVLGGDRDLAERPEIADRLGQRQHDLGGERARAPGARAAAPPAPRAARGRTRGPPPAARPEASRRARAPRARASTSSRGRAGQVADPLACRRSAGRSPQQGDLVGRVGPVAVGQAPGPHHLVPPLPRPEPRRRPGRSARPPRGSRRSGRVRACTDRGLR